MNEIDDVIKREFERLGINLVSNENLAELVILKANKRRHREYLLTALGFLAAITLGFGIYLAVTSGSSTSQQSVVESVGTSSDQSRVIILDLKGDGKHPIIYSTNVKLEPGRFLQLVSEIPEFAKGLAGTITVVPTGATEANSQIGRFDLGYGTHINEFGAFSGDLTLKYELMDPNFQGRVRLILAVK
ncbi:unannotated protein [freshwater metagenome]|uniref:Unannotated protein n=1 Tax=freshwater metagenome TaxID=449393 RepID=A0A6J6HIA9_9ZZZZ|nr:hypothetical protein [Actinomycetota bacterium]